MNNTPLSSHPTASEITTESMADANAPSAASTVARDALAIPEIADMVARAVFVLSHPWVPGRSRRTDWSKRPLKALRLTNKAFHDAATRYLYRDIGLDLYNYTDIGQDLHKSTPPTIDPHSSLLQIQGLESLSSSAHHRAPRSLRLNFASLRNLYRVTTAIHRDLMSNGANWLQTVLKRLVCIETVTLCYCYRPKGTENLPSLLGTLAGAAWTKMHELELHDVYLRSVSPSAYFSRGGFDQLETRTKSFLAGLNVVKLSFLVEIPVSRPMPDRSVLKEFETFLGLLSGMRHLHVSYWQEKCLNLNFDGLSYPCLQSLTLKEVCIATKALKQVLIQHQETLTCLELDMVELTTKYWALVIDCVTSLLPKLRELNMRCLNYHFGNRFDGSWDDSEHSDDNVTENDGDVEEHTWEWPVSLAFRRGMELIDTRLAPDFGPLRTHRQDDRDSWARLYAEHRQLKVSGIGPILYGESAKQGDVTNGRVHCSGPLRGSDNTHPCPAFRKFKVDELVGEEIWFCHDHQHLKSKLARWPWVTGRERQSRFYMYPTGEVS